LRRHSGFDDSFLMCGIAGFIGPWPRALAAAMSDALAHRGPDGAGVFHDPAAQITLAHRRLSIIDLSESGAQPMHHASGRFTITYNGEIYNYRELRAELAADGVTFRGASDTEVLLALYARDGAKCVERLNGIFAFAVWDAERRALFLARDHLGVKPLYYAALPQGFLFASELKALTLCPDLPRALDPAAVADHVGFLWTAGEATMLKAVRKLRPGCTLTVDRNRMRIERFYRVPVATDHVRADADELTARIDAVVKDQMVADVEVGALLSGGVDSSAIVAAMCRATDPGRITTFCAAVPKTGSAVDNFGDDQHFARIIAQTLGVKLIEVPTDADLFGALGDMLWQLDEPTADFAALQTYLLAKEARNNGIKVLLSGVGGDDLFTGYGRHTGALIYAKLARVPGLRPLAASLLRPLAPTTMIGRRLQRIGELLSLPEDRMLVEAMSYSAVRAEQRRGVLAPGLRGVLAEDGIPAPLRESLDRTRDRHPVERFLDLELNAFMPDHNLNYTDKMAMQAGVEVRVPLIDHRLVDYAMRIPIGAKIDLRQTKKILRGSQAARLPAEILTRPKQGFGVPLRAWLSGPARGMLEELTAPEVVAARGLFDPGAVAVLKRDFYARRVDSAFTLFPLMAIELWCRMLDRAPVFASSQALHYPAIGETA
jgi:asparagine synthase (glutamine-hydrolysing)